MTIDEIIKHYEQVLEDLKAYKEQSGDCISRQAVIDRINKQREGLEPEIYPQDKIGNRAYKICIEFIKDIPSVTPQQKMGRWIHHKEKMFDYTEHWECSQCHRTTMTYPFRVHGNDYDAMYYCPKCGAKMEVEDK